MGSIGKIVIYTKGDCSFCHLALDLLERVIDSQQTVIDIYGDDKMIADLKKNYPDHKTYPWIFFGEEFIGGYSNLQQLYQNGLEFALNRNNLFIDKNYYEF